MATADNKNIISCFDIKRSMIIMTLDMLLVGIIGSKTNKFCYFVLEKKETFNIRKKRCVLKS